MAATATVASKKRKTTNSAPSRVSERLKKLKTQKTESVTLGDTKKAPTTAVASTSSASTKVKPLRTAEEIKANKDALAKFLDERPGIKALGIYTHCTSCETTLPDDRLPDAKEVASRPYEYTRQITCGDPDCDRCGFCKKKFKKGENTTGRCVDCRKLACEPCCIRGENGFFEWHGHCMECMREQFEYKYPALAGNEGSDVDDEILKLARNGALYSDEDDHD